MHWVLEPFLILSGNGKFPATLQGVESHSPESRPSRALRVIMEGGSAVSADNGPEAHSTKSFEAEPRSRLYRKYGLKIAFSNLK